jgi:hypothetical protein
MTPDIAEALCVRVRELLPELDDAGFHINRFALLEARDRFSIGYEASVESIPDVLVDAVAAVTRTGVDFDYPGAIARPVHARTSGVLGFAADCVDRGASGGAGVALWASGLS